MRIQSAFASVLVLCGIYASFAQPVISDGQVFEHQKITSTVTDPRVCQFGQAITNLGDLDGDGVDDLAVSESQCQWGYGSSFVSGVWILQMNRDGTVKHSNRIGQESIDAPVNGYTSIGTFGESLAALGDLDGDHIPDLAVGDREANYRGSSIERTGAVYILFLNADGTVKGHHEIENTSVDLVNFGVSVANLGDIDGDGKPELAVGVSERLENEHDRTGSVFILSLLPDGSVSEQIRITGTAIFEEDKLHIGESIGTIDLDKNGIVELVLGDGYNQQIFIVTISPEKSVAGYKKINATEGGFTGTLQPNDSFGFEVISIGDLNGDNIPELIVSSPSSNNFEGEVWILFMQENGTVKSYQKVSETAGNFNTFVYFFGYGIAAIGDINEDQVNDFAVGEYNIDGGEWRGAVHVLLLNAVPALRNPVPDQHVREGESFSFQIPGNSFSDNNVGDILKYEAFLNGDEPLPGWLGFDTGTLTFSGQVPSGTGANPLGIRVKVTDLAGATAEDEFLIMVDTHTPPVAANTIPDQDVFENTPFDFQIALRTFYDADPDDILTYSATLSDGSLLPAWLSFNEQTGTFTGTPLSQDVAIWTITVAASDGEKTSGSISFRIIVHERQPYIFVPNLFSPGNDGRNDFFRVRGEKIASIQLSIFNVFGVEVFSTRDLSIALQAGWDGTYKGTQQPSGIYVWKLNGSFQDGTSLSVSGKTSGQVFLLR